MSAGIRQSVRHPSISDSKVVVVVDVSSWIIEAFSSIASCSADAGVGAKRPGEAAGNWS